MSMSENETPDKRMSSRYTLLTLVAVLLAGPWIVPHVQALDHVFYYDGDQDSYGDVNHPITVGIDWLPNRFVTYRAGDPDDSNNWVFPWPYPKGDRALGIDLVDLPESGTWRGDLFDEIAFDSVSVRIPWNAIESAPGDYSGDGNIIVDAIGSNLSGGAVSASITVGVIDRNHLALPEDLLARIDDGSLRMNDVEVVSRFAALLDHVHATLDQVDIVNLSLGHEIDRLFAVYPDIQFWIDFQVFYFTIANHAKSLWGTDLRVGLTATHFALMNEPQRALMNYLNSTSDFVGLTYFPRNDDFTVADPSMLDIKADLSAIIANNHGKPLHLQALGYPTSGDAHASEMKQSQFLYKFFDAWDSLTASIPFVSFAALHDPAPGIAYNTALSELVEPAGIATATAYYGSLGLRTRAADGTHKTGYNSLRNLAFERGWWREHNHADRPYLMGFTPELFDFPDEVDEVMAVEAFLFEKMDNDADFINVHMDSGIPWLEAFADTFDSTTPPYSEHLLETWTAQKNRIPPDSKVMISINPLGIPRSRLAAYWGVGEVFQYQQEPPWDRIPLGVVSDGAPRIPPPPWDSYGLSDEPVKQAFVNYARRTIEFFDPDYLLVGIEISATQVEDETAWQEYKLLHQHVYTELKLLYPDLPILVSVSGTSYMTDEQFPLLDDRNAANGHTWKFDEMEPGVRERLKQGLIDILPYTDILALSVYPHFGKYNAYQLPATMWDQMFALLQEIGAGDKPIAIAESGYSADPFYITLSEEYPPFLFAGSPEKQADFLKLMFYELRKSTNPVEFVVNYQVRDGDLWWQRLFSSGDDIFNQFYQYFRDIGMYAGDGSERPATLLWKQEFALPVASDAVE